MAETGKDTLQIQGPTGSLPVQFTDKVTRQLAMIIEGKCLGLGPTKAAKKYGYSKQRFFQILRAFLKDGSDALIPKKTGPKANYIRTENVVSQIIRHRFLDPEAKSEVIAQKLRQTGMKVSQRTVERTITEYGLQKKTLQVSAQGQRAKN
jgi:transposase